MSDNEPAKRGCNNGDDVRLTPTQQRFMDMLRDGRPHNIHELRELLQDKEATLGNVHQHIYHMRVRLRPYKRGILAEVVGGVVWFRLVNHVVTA